MGKSKFIPTVSTEITGVAEVNDKQQDSYNASPIEYTPGCAYAVPMQKAHQVSVTYGGQEYKSKRVFAAELKKDNSGKWKPTGNLTAIKLSNIRGTYFAEVIEGESAPTIMTEVGDGGALHMIGAEFIKACKGATGLGCKDHTPFVKYPVLFEFNRTVKGYVPKFENNALVAAEDESLVLDTTNMPTFTCTPGAGNFTLVLGDLIDLEDPKYAVLAL